MEESEILSEISRIVTSEWTESGRPVLLSNLPRALEKSIGADYRACLKGATLKSFLTSAQNSGVKLVQDPAHRARVGVIPEEEDFQFPSPRGTTATNISVDDARAFHRVLAAMTPDEQRAVMLPASLVARLLDAR